MKQSKRQRPLKETQAAEFNHDEEDEEEEGEGAPDSEEGSEDELEVD